MFENEAISITELRTNFALAATLENARAWELDTEKFTFCVDLLEVSAHENRCTKWVDALEKRFNALITADNKAVSPVKYLKTMEIRRYAEVHYALLDHEKITGSKFFECYEHMESSVLHTANRGRFDDWMVDIDTGDIYFITIAPDGLKCLNKLSLSYMMDNCPFHEVTIGVDFISIDSVNFSRTQAARALMAKMDMIVI